MIPTPAGLPGDQLRRLRETFPGEIVTPTDEAYDEARRLWNSVFDRHPAVLVRPTTPAEVATAVRFAREHDLALAVRSGGHSAAGPLRLRRRRSSWTSPRMRGVTGGSGRRGRARANGGALLGELDVAAQAYGLVCPVGVVGHTGVAGLTLGGGIGRLQRKFGLTIDNVRAVELVTADGRLVRATESEEPELFWGLRGRRLELRDRDRVRVRLHPFGPGPLPAESWSIPASAGARGLGHVRDYAADAPDTVSASSGSIRPGRERASRTRWRPADRLPVWNHSGDAERVERDTAGLREARRRCP